MRREVFVAGASGVIGRRLIAQLLKAGYLITGMTRSPHNAMDLERLGATSVVADVFDGDRLREVVAAARPDVIIHQLTDLSLLAGTSAQAETAIARNARIRGEGTRNLVAAAVAAGVPRMVVQSIAWAYAPGKTPHDENDPLDRDAPAPRSTTVEGVIALENAVLQTPGLRSAVLRYGRLYGPGTATNVPMGDCPLHVDAAARAAVLALERDVSGVFNISEPGGSVSTEKATKLLAWDHSFRLS